MIHESINEVMNIGLRVGLIVGLVFGFTGWILTLSFNLLKGYIK